jgi:hypothetical protein
MIRIMLPLVLGFFGGVVAWFATTFVAQPIQRLIQLRERAALVLAKYDDHLWIGNPEARPPENNWLEERRKAYDDIGSELVAFADANTLLVRRFHHRLLGRRRLYIRSAGENLRTLGDAYPGTPSWDQIRRSAKSALKIAD